MRRLSRWLYTAPLRLRSLLRRKKVEQELDEEYHRFVSRQPRILTDEERAAIRRLAADIPALWAAPTTIYGVKHRDTGLRSEQVVVKCLAKFALLRSS